MDSSQHHCPPIFVKARQALDGGASGVVLPYMETVEQVEFLTKILMMAFMVIMMTMTVIMMTLVGIMVTLMRIMVTLTVMMNLSFENAKRPRLIFL